MIDRTMSLDQLHEKLRKHVDAQIKEWDSFVYASENGFYQGFEEIKIDGCRPTEKRFARYKPDIPAPIIEIFFMKNEIWN